MTKTNQHVEDYYKSRHYIKEFAKGIAPCECCLIRQHFTKKHDRHGVVEEVHHASLSYRGKRKHKEDGSDLMGVCKVCHDWIHAHHTKENKRYITRMIEHTKTMTKMFHDKKMDPQQEMREHMERLHKVFKRLIETR